MHETLLLRRLFHLHYTCNYVTPDLFYVVSTVLRTISGDDGGRPIETIFSFAAFYLVCAHIPYRTLDTALCVAATAAAAGGVCARSTNLHRSLAAHIGVKMRDFPLFFFFSCFCFIQ